MTRVRGAGIGLLVALVAVSGTGCGDDDGGDLASFCAAVDDLANDDPFAELEIASPEEMRTAFDELRDGVAGIADAAPADLAGRADRYRDAVDDLVDQLRGAGYDPRALDPLAYRSAVDDYEAAAVSIENAADDTCA